MRPAVRWLLLAACAVAAAAAIPGADAGAWCSGQTLVMFCDDFDAPRAGWTADGNGAQTATGSTAGGFAYNPNDWNNSTRGCTDSGAKYVGVTVDGADVGYLSPQPVGYFQGGIPPPAWYQVRNTLTSPVIDATGISLDSVSFKLRGSSEGTSNPPFDYLDVFVDVVGGGTYDYGRYAGNAWQDTCYTFTFPASGLSNQQFLFRFVYTQDSNTDSLYVVPCAPAACLPMDTLPNAVVCNAALGGGCLYGGMGWYVDDVLVKRYNTPPVARFSARAPADCLTWEFRDESTDLDGTIVAWNWTFGDGGTSTAQHPTHTYAAPGTYLVSLEVRDNEGARRRTEREVEVKCPVPPPPPRPPPPPPVPPPLAAFTLAVTRPPCSPATVSFADRSEPRGGPIVSWYWEFGDGATGDGPSPQHGYAEGTYRVVLHVTDVNGRLGSASLTLTVPRQAPCGGSLQSGLEHQRADGSPRDGVDAALAGADLDGDGVPDGRDSCPGIPDAGSDLDADGLDDACDADRDGDGMFDRADACPDVPDPLQTDADRDGRGDACDPTEVGAVEPAAVVTEPAEGKARAAPNPLPATALSVPAAPASAPPSGLALAGLGVAASALVVTLVARRRWRD